jgi:hypothetical protein
MVQGSRPFTCCADTIYSAISPIDRLSRIIAITNTVETGKIGTSMLIGDHIELTLFATATAIASFCVLSDSLSIESPENSCRGRNKPGSSQW